jgi:predicted phosphodiesterase
MRYALIADIHEDLVSLSLALKKIEKLRCDEIICLGDISGFSVPHYHYFDTRDAHACLKLVRSNCKYVIAGNHDLHAARQTPKVNPDFDYPDNWYALDYQERRKISMGQLWLYDHDELNPLYTDADKDFLRTLPESQILQVNDQKILLTHFIYPNLTGSMQLFYNDTRQFERHRTYMIDQNCTLGFTGHRHFAGLLVASPKGLFSKRYNSRYTPDNMDVMMVPPIAGNRIGNGFCIFDTESSTIKTKRI